MTKTFTTLFFTLAMTFNISAQSVVGGIVAEPKQFPWMASLTTEPDLGIPGCGATLIAPDWILTAAHCLIEIPGLISIDGCIINSVTFDQNILPEHAEFIGIEATFIHPAYSDFFMGGDGTGADLALVRLSRSSENPTIDIAETNDSLMYSPGMPGITMGWGTTDSGDLSDSLLYAHVSFFSDEDCAIQAPTFYPLNAGGNICAGYSLGEPVGGAAAGDSGGPLIYLGSDGRYKQVGIVSGGEGDITTETSPGVFTLVPHYREWIDSIMMNYIPEVTSVTDFTDESMIEYFANNKIVAKNLSNSESYRMNMYEMTGKLVQSTASRKGYYPLELKVNNLRGGIYIIELRNETTGRSFSEKIVVSGH